MKKVLRIVGIICLILLIAVGALLAYLSLTEYKPNDQEELQGEGSGTKKIGIGEELTVLTYNIGYGALDHAHDFFMDGGSDVNAESKQQVLENMQGIASTVYSTKADVTFLQEVDRDSHRSCNIDEASYLQAAFPGTSMTYATNFRCGFIPYPLPPIGKVEGGIVTLNQFEVTEAARVSLPVSFSWPIRVGQLKRCLLVERVPMEDSDRELVLINLHLEAYDDGEGKEKQTEQLFSLLQEEYEKGNYCIAGGDFNSIFDETVLEKYPLKDTEHFVPGKIDISSLGEGWRYCIDDTTPTSRLLNERYKPASNKTQYYVIDGFIVSPNIEVSSTETLDLEFENSDHNPVLLTAKLAKDEDNMVDKEEEQSEKSADAE